MEAGRFLSIQSSPWLMTADDLKQVEQLIAVFPWFSEAWQLRASYYMRHGHLEAQKALEDAAIRTQNRARLMHLVHAKPDEEPMATEPSAEPLTDVAMSDQQLEHFREELKIVSDLIHSPTDVPQNLDREMLQSALSAGYLLETLPIDEPEPAVGNEPESKTESVQQEAPSTFAGWLRNFSTPPSPTPSESGTQPKAPVANKETRKPAGDLLVTETLAKIYIAQKNYAEARKVYEKLLLKFPEKSGYFASQIKLLDNSGNV
jgi:tetratricopeptide (TPR) repeat protein